MHRKYPVNIPLSKSSCSNANWLQCPATGTAQANRTSHKYCSSRYLSQAYLLHLLCFLQSHHQFVSRGCTSNTHFVSVWWGSRRWKCQLWLRVSLLSLTPPGKCGTMHWNRPQSVSPHQHPNAPSTRNSSIEITSPKHPTRNNLCRWHGGMHTPKDGLAPSIMYLMPLSKSQVSNSRKLGLTELQARQERKQALKRV
jgi:hypothetical protein